MKEKLFALLNQDCLFKTERISVLNWNSIGSKQASIESVLRILTPNVTKALPDAWQNLDSLEKAEDWINKRKAESDFYALSLTKRNEVVGFLFLYLSKEKAVMSELRLGYLLAETIWGNGLGSELIKGLVKWSRESDKITSISGGVEKDNIASIKVLEKNGFHKSDEELPGDMLLYKIAFTQSDTVS